MLNKMTNWWFNLVGNIDVYKHIYRPGIHALAIDNDCNFISGECDFFEHLEAMVEVDKGKVMELAEEGRSNSSRVLLEYLQDLIFNVKRKDIGQCLSPQYF